MQVVFTSAAGKRGSRIGPGLGMPVSFARRQQFATGCPRLPMAMLEEIHPLTPGWPTASGGYLQLSEAYAGEAAKTGELGWPVRQLLSHHLALLTEPGRVAREVRKLIGEF